MGSTSILLALFRAVLDTNGSRRCRGCPFHRKKNQEVVKRPVPLLANTWMVIYLVRIMSIHCADSCFKGAMTQSAKRHTWRVDTWHGPFVSGMQLGPGPLTCAGSCGYGSKLSHQELDHRLWSLVPFTRASQFEYLLLDRQSTKVHSGSRIGSAVRKR